MNQAIQRKSESGMALISVLMLVALLSALLAAYFMLTRFELNMAKSTMDGNRGFYAAEAGANLRAEAIRQTFLGFNRPAGSTPTVTPGTLPCQGSQGSGDFQCMVYPFAGRSAVTYVTEVSGNPVSMVIPPGEPYAYLSANEYAYVVHSVAENPESRPEAILELHIKSRVVPMFQFAAFFNKDLEIVPEPPMTLEGRVHTNGDLYLASYDRLNIEGEITTVGTLYRGRKHFSSCGSADQPVGVLDPGAIRDLPGCLGGNRRTLAQSDLTDWNGMIRVGVDSVTVPTPDALDPQVGKLYWDRADMRVMLDLTGGTPAVKARNADGSLHSASAALNACGGGTVVTTNTDFYNNREGAYLQMLNVDMEGVLDCIQNNPGLIDNKGLDETSDGGLVFYFGFEGPNANGMNNYAVRVRNGDQLASTVPGAPEIQGLTVVTNQAMFIQGHYNNVNKKPAAFLSDSMNILSTAWTDDSHSLDCVNKYGGCPTTRYAGNTTINAAFLAGSDTTADIEGAGGQDQGFATYSGGLHNFPRFHEDWISPGAVFTYRGSFVSLNIPQHVDGKWVYGNPQYYPPNRDWHYETDFNDVGKLPPLTPRFAYLRQQLFARQFDI